MSLSTLEGKVNALRLMVGIGICTIFIGARVLGQSSSLRRGEELKSFRWPDGKKAAVSLSFDDARLSQVDNGLALFKKEGVKVTFFVQPSGVEKRLTGWKQAVADGHEIGNHSLTHPCTGNYLFSRNNALENYDLAMMARQLDEANEEIYKQLGVKPRTFAYPCGQKFVGRGREVRSYVPLVADRFLLGRGYLDESANDPLVCDLAQAMGTGFDDLDFFRIKKIVDDAVREGRWVIFVGHEIGERGYQTTDTQALEALCKYLKNPATGVWLSTVDEIASYIRKQRGVTNPPASKK
ncbi:MAG: polysaccharide deacetylase family protein [Candidatus Acidiferrum sp.]